MFHAIYASPYYSDVHKTAFHALPVLEIGCGDGYFLDLLEEAGFLDVAGFDGAYSGSDPRIQNRYFGEEDYGFNADIILMMQVLEHIPEPVNFLQKLISTNSNANAIFVIEVPSYDWIKSNEAWWDLSYEHCNYFTEQSFKEIFGKSCEIMKTFGDSYLLVIANGNKFGKNFSSTHAPHSTEENLVPLSKSFEFFKNTAIVDSHEMCGSSKYTSNKRYWIWGCGGKSVMFLCHNKQMNPRFNDPIGCIDVSLTKQGKYMPFSGYKIMAPEFMYENIKSDDLILVCNPLYVDEVKSKLQKNINKICRIVSF